MPRHAPVCLRSARRLRVAPLPNLVGPLVPPMRRAVSRALDATLFRTIDYELKSVDVAPFEDVLHDLEQIEHHVRRAADKLDVDVRRKVEHDPWVVRNDHDVGEPALVHYVPLLGHVRVGRDVLGVPIFATGFAFAFAPCIGNVWAAMVLVYQLAAARMHVRMKAPVLRIALRAGARRAGHQLDETREQRCLAGRVVIRSGRREPVPKVSDNIRMQNLGVIGHVAQVRVLAVRRAVAATDAKHRACL